MDATLSIFAIIVVICFKTDANKHFNQIQGVLPYFPTTLLISKSMVCLSLVRSYLAMQCFATPGIWPPRQVPVAAPAYGTERPVSDLMRCPQVCKCLQNKQHLLYATINSELHKSQIEIREHDCSDLKTFQTPIMGQTCICWSELQQDFVSFTVNTNVGWKAEYFWQSLVSHITRPWMLESTWCLEYNIPRTTGAFGPQLLFSEMTSSWSVRASYRLRGNMRNH